MIIPISAERRTIYKPTLSYYRLGNMSIFGGLSQFKWEARLKLSNIFERFTPILINVAKQETRRPTFFLG